MLAVLGAAGVVATLTPFAATLAVVGLALTFGFALFYVALRSYTGLAALTAEAVSLRRTLDEVQKGTAATRDITARVDKLQERLTDHRRTVQHRLESNLAELERRQACHAGATLDDRSAELRREMQEMGGGIRGEIDQATNDLGGRIDEARAAVQSGQDALFRLRSESAESEKRLEGLMADHARSVKRTEDRLANVESASVGFDLAQVALNLRPLWLGGSQTARRDREVDLEHGHALLMATLADEEASVRGTLAGKTLIEIGMTREPVTNQRSTQKLAFFAAMTDMYFIAVDMDPANVDRAKQFLPYLNPNAQAFAQKGEDFLRLHAGTIDYVYLDAFDFDHGKHSETRQDSYRKNLGTTINDEACWRMHEECARTLVKRMSPSGIVALDDTWTDPDGDYHGKGKIAVPVLLEAGFEIVARTAGTICLRRGE